MRLRAPEPLLSLFFQQPPQGGTADPQAFRRGSLISAALLQHPQRHIPVDLLQGAVQIQRGRRVLLPEGKYTHMPLFPEDPPDVTVSSLMTRRNWA